MQQSTRYCGALPCRHLCMITHAWAPRVHISCKRHVYRFSCFSSHFTILFNRHTDHATTVTIGRIACYGLIVLFCSIRGLATPWTYFLHLSLSSSHSDWLFHGESCPRLDVVHPGRAWPSSPTCTWHCSLHYIFLQATPLFPRGVTIVC